MPKNNIKTSTPNPHGYTAQRVKDEVKLLTQSEPAGEPRPKNPATRGYMGQAQATAPKGGRKK